MASSSSKFVRYSVMPGILPRVKSLFESGFALVANLIAVIYYNVGILPANHQYLDPKNYGRYGVRHVIAEAANRIEFNRDNIDKVVIFMIILMGMVLLMAQFVLFALTLFSFNPAMASTWYNVFVNTPAPHSSYDDIAFMALESVFGVRQYSGSGSTLGFFNSCVSNTGVYCTDYWGAQMEFGALPAAAPYPSPFHSALHQMFRFYSGGIAFLAMVVILYHVVAIVGETIATGTPFGQRMNRAWFIPRLIVFFALIAPVSTSGNNDGISVGQMFVFAAAKFGSNMATNAWLDYVSIAARPVAGGNVMPDMFGAQSTPQWRSFVARPNVPEVGELTQFMHIVRMCMFAERIVNNMKIRPYAVREHSTDTSPVSYPGSGGSETYAEMGGFTEDALELFNGETFEEVVRFSRFDDVIIRFGHYNPPETTSYGSTLTDGYDPDNPPGAYDNELGYVDPVCGEIQMHIMSVDMFVIGGPVFGIQQNYYDSLREYILQDMTIDTTAYCMLQAILPYHQDNVCVDENYTTDDEFPVGSNHFQRSPNTKWLTADAARAVIERYNSKNKFYLVGETTNDGTYNYDINEDMFASPSSPYSVMAYYDNVGYPNHLVMSNAILAKGWAGAGLWYNQIAQVNGFLTDAVQNYPRPFRYPKVMEQIASYHLSHDSNTSYERRFNPRLQNGELVPLPRPGDQYIAAALYSSYSLWNSATVQETVYSRHSSNAIVDVINMMLGTFGLYDVVDNKYVHPMAFLSALGKSMVDAAVMNMFAGFGGLIAQLVQDDFVKSLGSVISSFAFKFGMIGLSIGFILYYILPLMPFIYFFFAFCGWVKSIFEAIVAIPLWALAHIKMDGEGLPGPWATNGYFLLFEIFLRPILIIAGFVASVTMFTALVDVFNTNFSLIAINAAGFDVEKALFPGDGPTPMPAAAGEVLLRNPGGSIVDYWRGSIDEFFFTAIYIIIVYMIGLSCFKLVDQIPNNIIRWMGATVSTFHEQAGDPAGELTSKVFRGSQMTNAQISGFLDRLRGRPGGDAVTNTMIAGAAAGK